MNDDQTTFEGSSNNYIDKDYEAEKAVGADCAAAGSL